MDTKYFRVPFATSGDVLAIPDDTQIDGSVSYEQGFGPDYELEQSDPDSKDVPRDQSNQLYLDITENLKQYQEFAVPQFITTADNDGSPFSYSKDAMVRYDDGSGEIVYISLVNSNTALPTDTTKWATWAQFLVLGNRAGALIASSTYESAAVTTVTASIPVDDTVPLVSEGDQVLTGAHTAASATNKVRVNVKLCGTTTTVESIVVAVFQDSTIIDVAVVDINAAFSGDISFTTAAIAAGGTSSKTYSVRVGTNTGTFYVNGNSAGTRLFGGAMKATMTVEELQG